MGTLVIVYTKSSYDDIPPTYCVYILIHIFIAKFPTELVKLNLTLTFYQYILLLEKVIDSLGLFVDHWTVNLNFGEKKICIASSNISISILIY